MMPMESFWREAKKPVRFIKSTDVDGMKGCVD
jgi:hypothetical protein